VGQRAHAGIIWFSIALCAIPVLHRVAGIRAIQHRNPFWIVPFVFPGPDHGFHPVPVCAMRPAACRGGLIVNVPANNDFLIYYAPLPAAPLPEPTLTWRRPGDLRSGFRIEQP
jgi:hypothetical protein